MAERQYFMSLIAEADSPLNVPYAGQAADNCCVICNKALSGRQRRFCSRTCKNRSTQGYNKQQARGLRRKLQVVLEMGGKCSVCGYAKNLAALTFHHSRSEEKEFGLDLRALSNRKLDASLAELEKCELVCANCHAEIHHPHLMLSQLASEQKVAHDEFNT